MGNGLGNTSRRAARCRGLQLADSRLYADAMQEDQATVIVSAWSQAAYRQPEAWDLPFDEAARTVRPLPESSLWAISSDARCLWLLSPDETFYTVSVSEDLTTCSTSTLPLSGARLSVDRVEGSSRMQRDVLAVRETDWTFKADGQEFLSLTGATMTDQVRGTTTSDPRQALAEAVAALVDRSA